MLEFDGIGTHWWIENLSSTRFDATTKQAVLRHVHDFDSSYSRFKSDSLIGTLNNKKYLKNPPKELLSMLGFCKEMYEASDGVFDVTIGGILHSQGYGSREMASKVVSNFWDEVKYNRDEIRIPAEAVIDTGGYGKGWLIDELVDLLAAHGYKNVIVNGGGDLRIANDEPVEFSLEHPYDTNKKIGTTHIQNGALAVSSAAKRTWMHDGKTYHHIVDPKSEASLKNDVVATYVEAPTALLADTLATICMIRPDLAKNLEHQYAARIGILRDIQLG